MERALRLLADKTRSVTFSADVIRIVMVCADSCGRALRTIRRVRKCVCDWGIWAVCVCVRCCFMPQSHTHLRTLTESFRSKRNRPQKNNGGPYFLMRLQDAATYSCG